MAKEYVDGIDTERRRVVSWLLAINTAQQITGSTGERAMTLEQAAQSILAGSHWNSTRDPVKSREVAVA